jgi:hypothetical protein
MICSRGRKTGGLANELSMVSVIGRSKIALTYKALRGFSIKLQSRKIGKKTTKNTDF